ncbi:MAG: hypothetical protein DLM67_24745 [Candidatus Nephthysia bennettiae]|nr:MAG: hypothetical protein DLM67_24745 [Candidatus Dormibacteraeota bacterium]
MSGEAGLSTAGWPDPRGYLWDRLQVEFDRVRTVGSDSESAAPGLYIPEEEVTNTLRAGAAEARWPLDAERLDLLARHYALTAFEVDVLVACLAPDLDPSFERIYGFLQDALSRTRPAVGLLLRLFCPDPTGEARARGSFRPTSPLFAGELLRLPEGADAPLLAQAPRADERVVGHLIGDDSVDGRAGDLRALVATASLELGIDIGPVELVCQIGSPRSFATFLQRVGRSNHTRFGTPRGVLYPTSRDELVECAALLRGTKAGRLDAIIQPVAPLDIVAQQIVAECSAEEWAEDGLFDLVRRAAPFEGLSREDFDDVVEVVSEGITTGRGRRAAYLHRDRVNGRLKGRRGARLAAVTSGGAIPELGDYRVVAEPDDTFVGTVNEDWAIESMAGDVFLLGTTSWRIRRVEPGTVRVIDARGEPPSVPFWLGEAPGRTEELSSDVSELRARVGEWLESGDADGAGGWLKAECGIDEPASETIVRYLATGLAELGVLPTKQRIVLERFFDESGGMQLVGHSPFGARLNRGLGLALRKRFCVNFDFELQAAASDDAILLSLGPQHSFPLEQVPKFLSSKTVESVLKQALLTSPLFAARWRWNLNRALAVLRMRGGHKNPPAIQRMESDDLMAAVFPTLAACQENLAPGPIEIPDHPLVRQTVDDCLREAMDVDGLRELLSEIEAGRIEVVTRDTVEPSVLSHEILNGRPFTYLDDAPLEERRSRSVQLRRGLPVEARDLGRLDPAAIERVREEARPDPHDDDELHDLLLTVSGMRPVEEWRPWFEELVEERRAVTVHAGPRLEL